MVRNALNRTMVWRQYSSRYNLRRTYSNLLNFKKTIIHEQNTKEITTVAVVLYLIKHMWIIIKLLLRFARRIQHLH